MVAPPFASLTRRHRLGARLGAVPIRQRGCRQRVLLPDDYDLAAGGHPDELSHPGSASTERSPPF